MCYFFDLLFSLFCYAHTLLQVFYIPMIVVKKFGFLERVDPNTVFGNLETLIQVWILTFDILFISTAESNQNAI